MDYKYLFEALSKYLDDGVLVCDANANVKCYNEKAMKMMGVNLNEGVGKNILEIFSDITKDTSKFYKVLRTKEPILDYEQGFDNYSGITGTFHGSCIPVVKEGEAIAAIEILKDIDWMRNLSDKVAMLQNQLYGQDSNENKKKRLKNNGTTFTINDIIGESKEIEKLKDQILKIANSDSTILIVGETGTGKELFAQAIHNKSKERRNKPFIAQNCAAIPKPLLEGILFGTTQGSFTGAQNKRGIFEIASGGTLFLDEINSMDIELQAKLLRVMQNGMIRRVGGEKEIPVDVRIVASTNEDPLKAVEKNILRQDLYYRLSVIDLIIPPLRERKSDIEILTNHFIDMYNGIFNKKIENISVEIFEVFSKYHWPGNVRELQYTIEKIMHFIEKDKIHIDDIPDKILNSKISKKTKKQNIALNDEDLPLKESVKKYEKELIQKAIIKANGNCSKAARILKIPKQTLYNKLKKYNIEWYIHMDEEHS